MKQTEGIAFSQATHGLITLRFDTFLLTMSPLVAIFHVTEDVGDVTSVEGVTGVGSVTDVGGVTGVGSVTGV